MGDAGNLILTIGSFITMFGLVLVGAQVRTHSIQRIGIPSLVVRIGVLMVVAGLILLLLAKDDTNAPMVGLVVGGLTVLIAGLTGHHESMQADSEGKKFNFAHSLMFEMFLLADAMIILAILNLVY